MTRWDVRLRFRAAYTPSGSGIVERCHRSVKVIMARKGCTVAEAVHLYNLTPKDGGNASTAPANALYAYRVRLRGLDKRKPETCGETWPYAVGDLVWVKPPGVRCNTRYLKGEVTNVTSEHVVEVNGTPRHVKDLRHRSVESSAEEPRDAEEESGPLIPLTAHTFVDQDDHQRFPVMTTTTPSTPVGTITHDPAEQTSRISATPIPERTGIRRSSRAQRSRRCICCD
uniref:Integrase catalytic domain-containing protein n=1 Tax=Trichuris muris TaxID=70415 RepID=A0A5S6QZG4_TRIMR